jgi:uncharacterized protein
MINLKSMAAALFLGLVLTGGTASAQTANTSSIELSLPGSQERLLIGGGLPFGLYFPLAGTLCRLVETADEPALCAVATLADSDAAIAALQDGSLPFALVQSDWLYHAVRGSSRYQETGPAEGLRAVAAFYTEAFTVFAKATGPISKISDLKGKRVSVGADTSYRGILANVALATAGLERDDLAEASAEPVVTAIERLCDGQTDAVVVMAVHPAEYLTAAGRRCGITPLSFSDSEVADLLGDLPGYASVVIPARTYPGQAVPVKTVGLRPVLVTTVDADDAVVGALTTAIARGLTRLNEAHPAFSTIRIEDLTSASLFAPMNPAAARALGITAQ